jgi:hypothetical protein
MVRRVERDVELRRVDYDALPELGAGLELLVCQTPQWLLFLKGSQRAEPVLAQLLVNGEPSGVFTGAILRKAGLKILGSPLRGWTTSYMGFALRTEVESAGLLSALRSFAFDDLHCAHVELLDRALELRDYGAPWQTRALHGYEIDLSRSEEAVFSAMTSACRRCIRKAENCGVSVEVADDPAGFAAEYYAQLKEVFAKDGVRPTYSQARVEQLIEALRPAGMLLLLRARDVSGRCIGTSIFPGYGRQMYFWGGASRRDALLSRPNEAMLWQAMRWWKARGAACFDMGGGGNYKAKYGGTPIAVPWGRVSRSPLVAALRSGAEQALRLRQRLIGTAAGSRRH